MADIEKTRNTLQVVAEFTDGDDRTLSFENPAELTEAEMAARINDASAYAKANNLLLGDKNGADFTRFKTARKIVGTTKYLDLTE